MESVVHHSEYIPHHYSITENYQIRIVRYRADSILILNLLLLWTNIACAATAQLLITNIPRDANEEEIITMFLPFGPVYEFRLMMYGNSGLNRTYAYLSFLHGNAARDVLTHSRHCNLFMIRPNHRLIISPNNDKRTLLVYGFRADMTHPELTAQVSYTNPELMLVCWVHQKLVLRYSSSEEAVSVLFDLSVDKHIRFGQTVQVRFLRPFTNRETGCSCQMLVIPNHSGPLPITSA